MHNELRPLAGMDVAPGLQEAKPLTSVVFRYFDFDAIQMAGLNKLASLFRCNVQGVVKFI